MTISEALQLLELTPPFTKAELKKAYHQAQMVWHPDRFTGNAELHAKAHARAYLINDAFTEISRALESGYVFKKTIPRQAATYRKAASQEPPKKPARLNRSDFRKRGKLFESGGAYDKAIAAYSEVVRSFKHGRSDYWRELVGDYFSRARVYRLKGDLDHAIADYSEIIKLSPTTVLGGGWQPTAVYYKCRAQTYYEKGDFSSALADLTEVMRRDPTGRWSIFQGDCRCIGPDPSDEGWKHKTAISTLGALYAKAGDFDHATLVQKKFLELPGLTAEEAAEGRKCLAFYESH